jgi:hypothetical protein
VNEEDFEETQSLHAPTLDAQLSEQGSRLLLVFADGRQEELGRSDIERSIHI